MGGVIVVPTTLWSAEELEEIEQVKKCHEFAVSFVEREHYRGIPFRHGRKNTDPTAALWIEPILAEHDRNDGDAEFNRIHEDVLQNAPSGIMVDRKGKFTILFSLQSISHTFTINEAEKYLTDMKMNEELLQPDPPILYKATKTTLELQWYQQLPYPIGIIQGIEVQYSIFEMNRIETENHENIINSPSIKWFTLVSRKYNQSEICTYKCMGVPPGTHYITRLRYRTSGPDWSVYSPSSKVFSTLPDHPLPPISPELIAITSFAIQIKWDNIITTNSSTSSSGSTTGVSQNMTSSSCKTTTNTRINTNRDNGSPIYEYILASKQADESEYRVIYRGNNSSYLSLGLNAECVYSFQLAAVNSIGPSEYSIPVSIQTLSKPLRNSSILKTLQNIKTTGIEIQELYPQYSIVNHIYTTSNTGNDDIVRTIGYSIEQIELARQCAEAWCEYWDPLSEQPFYYNSILAIRQFERPAIFHTTTSSSSNNSSSGSRNNTNNIQLQSELITQTNNNTNNINIPDIEFRKKRYRFYHLLKKMKNKNLKKNSNITIKVNRLTLLSDCYKQFIDLNTTATSTNNSFDEKFIFQFIGEKGLDAGGLSKEAFLLLSQHSSYYCGKSLHCYMHTVPYMLRDQNHNYSSSSSSNSSSKKEENNENKRKNEDLGELREGYFFTAVSTTNITTSATVSNNHTTATTTTSSGTTTTTANATILDSLYPSILELDAHLRVSSVDFCYFLGLLLGKALYDRQLVSFPLSPLLIQYIIGMPMLWDDIDIDSIEEGGNECHHSSSTNTNGTSGGSRDTTKERVLAAVQQLQYLDYTLYTSLLWMAEHDITNVIYETFSIETTTSGTTTTPSTTNNTKCIDLCYNGHNIEVTDTNKYKYIILMIQYKFKYSIETNLNSFLNGFYKIIPIHIIKKCNFTEYEINLILNGKERIHIEELQAYCIYPNSDVGFNEIHDTIRWFWKVVMDMEDTERRKLLQFWTGTGCVPLDGFDPALNITQSECGLNSLPVAHTCFNQLELPCYSNYAVCRRQLAYAMDNTMGFELA